MKPAAFFTEGLEGTFSVHDGQIVFRAKDRSMAVKPYGSAGLLFSVEGVEQPDTEETKRKA